MMKPTLRSVLPTKSEYPTWIPDRCLIMCLSGSHMYGTSLPTSDVDVRGIVLPPPEVMLDPFNSFETTEWREPVDGGVHALDKYIRLACDNNPNILELMFADEKSIIHLSVLGQELIAQRQHFLSKNVFHRYSGYAHAQIKRVRSHRAWLLHPPDHQPTRHEFGLPETSTIAADERGAAEALINPNKEVLASDDWTAKATAAGFSSHMIDILWRERKYASAKKHWAQYQEWKANRNPSRHALEAAYGYDTKHMMHCFRLLRQGKELLLTGTMNVLRPDAEELLRIRAGCYTFDEMEEMFQKEESLVMDAYTKTTLPTKPNREHIAKWYMNAARNSLMGEGV